MQMLESLKRSSWRCRIFIVASRVAVRKCHRSVTCLCFCRRRLRPAISALTENFSERWSSLDFDDELIGRLENHTFSSGSGRVSLQLASREICGEELKDTCTYSTRCKKRGCISVETMKIVFDLRKGKLCMQTEWKNAKKPDMYRAQVMFGGDLNAVSENCSILHATRIVCVRRSLMLR